MKHLSLKRKVTSVLLALLVFLAVPMSTLAQTQIMLVFELTLNPDGTWSSACIPWPLCGTQEQLTSGANLVNFNLPAQIIDPRYIDMAVQRGIKNIALQKNDILSLYVNDTPLVEEELGSYGKEMLLNSLDPKWRELVSNALTADAYVAAIVHMPGDTSKPKMDKRLASSAMAVGNVAEGEIILSPTNELLSVGGYPIPPAYRTMLAGYLQQLPTFGDTLIELTANGVVLSSGGKDVNHLRVNSDALSQFVPEMNSPYTKMARNTLVRLHAIRDSVPHTKPLSLALDPDNPLVFTQSNGTVSWEGLPIAQLDSQSQKVLDTLGQVDALVDGKNHRLFLEGDNGILPTLQWKDGSLSTLCRRGGVDTATCMWLEGVAQNSTIPLVLAKSQLRQNDFGKLGSQQLTPFDGTNTMAIKWGKNNLSVDNLRVPTSLIKRFFNVDLLGQMEPYKPYAAQFTALGIGPNGAHVATIDGIDVMLLWNPQSQANLLDSAAGIYATMSETDEAEALDISAGAAWILSLLDKDYSVSLITD